MPAKKPKKKASPNKSAKKTSVKPAARGALAKERVNAILAGLDEAYPEAECALTHRSPWELLVATILSAQCTDVRVNMVTPELFRRFPSPRSDGQSELARDLRR
jgi:endonuclease III